MNQQKPPPRHLARYVEELVEVGVQLARILDHMYRHPDPDAGPPPIVLRDLVTGTLAPHLARRKGELHAATSVLLKTGETIENEIFLVDPEQMDDLLCGDELDDPQLSEEAPSWTGSYGNGHGPPRDLLH